MSLNRAEQFCSAVDFCAGYLLCSVLIIVPWQGEGLVLSHHTYVGLLHPLQTMHVQFCVSSIVLRVSLLVVRFSNRQSVAPLLVVQSDERLLWPYFLLFLALGPQACEMQTLPVSFTPNPTVSPQ